jgi:serine acetyltransferase
MSILQGIFLGDSTMRMFVALAIVVSASIGLGGCFGHHQETVVVEPLKLG